MRQPKEIRKLRKQLALSQSKFAKKYGIPVRTLQKWEQGVAEPLPYLMALIQEEIDIEDYIKVEQFYLTNTSKQFEVVSKPFKNANKIHPVQQNNVLKIIEELSKYDEVKKIIVFGSSVTNRCNYESDLDIYVELTKEKNVKTYSVDVSVDFWTNFTVEPPMMEEINNNGVLVYGC